MTIFRPLYSPAFALLISILSTSVVIPSAQAATTAVDQLIYYDKYTASGLLEVKVDLYDPPNSKGQYGAAKTYPAQLLFARPDQFKLVLRPGAKDEFRAVGSTGTVNWVDYATGFYGKEKAEDVTDPVALALLGSAGELLRFAPAKELPVSKQSVMRGATLSPKSYGSNIRSATAWFNNDQPIGFEFLLNDKRRVFISILSFKQNVSTKPGDFQL